MEERRAEGKMKQEGDGRGRRDDENGMTELEGDGKGIQNTEER